MFTFSPVKPTTYHNYYNTHVLSCMKILKVFVAIFSEKKMMATFKYYIKPTNTNNYQHLGHVFSFYGIDQLRNKKMKAFVLINKILNIDYR